MGKIIAIANHKGGVAKTTTVANIGAILASKGKRVLLIDLDAQANLTSYFIDYLPEETIYNSLIEEKPLPITNLKEGLDLVASSINMLGIEAKLANNIDRLELLLILLEPLGAKYDYILLDCPPSLEVMTINALIASDDVYIPLLAETIPLRGIGSLLDLIANIQRRKNKALKLSGVIITRYGGRKINKQVETALEKRFKEVLFKTRIRENIAIAEAPSRFMDIVSYNPNSNGAKDYTSLVEEILNRNK